MAYGRAPSVSDRFAPFPGGDMIADHRARLAVQESEAKERRRKAAEEQVSVLNTPDQRIRVWERVHELALPRDPMHPLLAVIAARTNLSLEQVREEQRRRGPITSATSGAGLSWNSAPVR